MSELLELIVDKHNFRVSNRESEHREFKSSFDDKNVWKYAKTIVSFANKDGGVIFYGIKDSPRELVGINGFLPTDLVISNFLNEYFEPEIRFQLGTKEYYGKTVLYILVEPSYHKPVICKKRRVERFLEKGKSDRELLREGAIYYRYSSAVEEIKYPELVQILQSRTQNLFTSLIDNITLINKVGHQKAAIVNAEDLSGNDKSTSVYITTETAKNINWIQKGRFAETQDGSEKAYYVTRQIEIKHGVEIEKPVDPSKTHTLTKTELGKLVKLNSLYINAILWKLGLLDNETYHVPITHGKNMLHKFTNSTIERILAEYPLEMARRNELIKIVYAEYQKSLR